MTSKQTPALHSGPGQDIRNILWAVVAAPALHLYGASLIYGGRVSVRVFTSRVVLAFVVTNLINAMSGRGCLWALDFCRARQKCATRTRCQFQLTFGVSATGSRVSGSSRPGNFPQINRERTQTQNGNIFLEHLQSLFGDLIKAIAWQRRNPLANSCRLMTSPFPKGPLGGPPLRALISVMPCCLPGWQLTVIVYRTLVRSQESWLFAEPCRAPIHLFAIWLNLMKMLQPAIYKTNANKTWDCLLAPAPWATTPSWVLGRCSWDAGSVLSTHRERCHLFAGWRSQTNECKRFLTASSSRRSKNVLKWQKTMTVMTVFAEGLGWISPHYGDCTGRGLCSNIIEILKSSINLIISFPPSFSSPHRLCGSESGSHSPHLCATNLQWWVIRKVSRQSEDTFITFLAVTHAKLPTIH